MQEDVVGHKGPVWIHVISLRREDAARLGYDSTSQWMALLRSKRAMLCRHMKIDSANLYEEQNQARAALKSGTEDVLQRRMKELQSGTFVSAPIERMMLTLSRRLQDTSGKKFMDI